VINRKLRYRRILVLTGIISLLIIYPVLYARMLSSPQDRTGADFIHFYTAGLIAQRYGPQEVYDISLQRMVEQDIVGFELAENQVLIYNHMPFLIPVLKWMMSSNYVFSFVRWSLFSLFLYIVAIGLLLDMVDKKSALDRQRSLLFIGAITFYPLFVSIVDGQDTAILSLGLALWIWGFSKEKDEVAGAGLALAAIRPHVALMLALPFFFRRRKIFWWFLASAVGLGIISFWLIGTKGINSFARLLLITAGGDWFGMNRDKMVNLLGLLLRLFPSLPIKALTLTGWTFYILATIGLCVWWAKSRNLEIRHLATAILAAILFVPHLHYHDLTLLLIPVIILILYRGDLPLLNDLPELPLIISMALLFSGTLLIIKLSVPYIVVLVLLVLLWLPKNFGHREEKAAMESP
jgi:Glycosyltransferase family 87